MLVGANLSDLSGRNVFFTKEIVAIINGHKYQNGNPGTPRMLQKQGYNEKEHDSIKYTDVTKHSNVIKTYTP